MNWMPRPIAALATLALVVASTSPLAPRAWETSVPRTVRIATQSPLSGRYRAQGEALMLAVKLAVEDLGSALTKHGLAVEVVTFDNRANATVGASEAHRIVADQFPRGDRVP